MFGGIVRKFAKAAYISVIKDGDVCDVCVKILKNKTPKLVMYKGIASVTQSIAVPIKIIIAISSLSPTPKNVCQL